jgi:hypothetical protein
LSKKKREKFITIFLKLFQKINEKGTFYILFYEAITTLMPLRRQRSRGSRFEASPMQIVCETLSQKYSTEKRAGGVADVMERLP